MLIPSVHLNIPRFNAPSYCYLQAAPLSASLHSWFIQLRLSLLLCGKKCKEKVRSQCSPALHAGACGTTQENQTSYQLLLLLQHFFMRNTAPRRLFPLTGWRGGGAVVTACLMGRENGCWLVRIIR